MTEIRGKAGSRGTLIGIAGVVFSLDGAGALQTGEILVFPTTAPSSTPLFRLEEAEDVA